MKRKDVLKSRYLLNLETFTFFVTDVINFLLYIFLNKRTNHRRVGFRGLGGLKPQALSRQGTPQHQ